MDDWLNQIEAEILNRKLIQDSVLVAVSGGLDSMVLLHVLLALAKKHGWKISVAHFNHRLRGRSSDADERLVRMTCQKCKVPFEAGSADVKQFAKAQKISLEMAARKLRHAFLARLAWKQKIPTVALAHHADDQVELFLLRLLRGSGSEGLAGMKWSSPSPSDAKIRLVRPLLQTTKAELEAYSLKYKVPFREDATNACLDMQRNKIRHQLVPILKKEFQPALVPNLLRTMKIVSAEAEFISQTAKEWLKEPGEFEQLPIALQRRILLEQLWEVGVLPEFDLIEKLRSQPGEIVNAAENLKLSRTEAGKLEKADDRPVSFRDEVLQVDTWRKCKVLFGRLHFSWKRAQSAGSKFERLPNTEYFDAEKVGRKITLRFWQPGDRFQPIGMKKPVKLQDLFTNAKLPQQERHHRVIAAAENGKILWVEGFRISEEFKLLTSSKHRLVWSWKCRR